jgi:2-deoxy-D-gluconate 3-dehydrogenase
MEQRFTLQQERHPALIEKAKELSELYGGECIPFPCDLSTFRGIDSFSDMIADKEDGIDYLINNAGAAWGEPFESFSEAGWDKVMDLNVKSLFFLTQKMKPLLAKKATLEDPSRVINIGSIDGLNVPGFPTFSYSTSKAAVHHLTRHLAAQLVSENITVNAIAPGPYPVLCWVQQLTLIILKLKKEIQESELEALKILQG